MSDGTPKSTPATGSPSALLTVTPDAAELAVAPPLSGLCALAALCAMAINQVALPALPGGPKHALYLVLGQAGRFSANLAVIAGTIALVASAITALRTPAFMSLRRRMLAIVFLTLLLRAVVIATLFSREETTRENVYLAVGAANVLCIFAGMAVIEAARSRLSRMLAWLAAALPTISMLAVTLELMADLSFDPWKRRAHELLTAGGELTYLALLLTSALLLVPRELRRPRAGFARAVGFAVLMASLLGLYQAQRTLQADYGILMYHAQRVGLMLDRWPLIYALPFGVGLGGALSAMIVGGARMQAGTAMLLIFASGYAPQTPGRLLCMTLGFVLLSRAITSLDSRATPAT